VTFIAGVLKLLSSVGPESKSGKVLAAQDGILWADDI